MKTRLLFILAFIQLSFLSQATESYDAILVPNTVAEDTIVLYESNFTDGNDDWTTADKNDAASSISNVDGVLVCEIGATGTDLGDGKMFDNVKFYRPGILLQPSTQYLVTFSAKASEQRPIVAYIGQSAQPYAAFSGYKSFLITEDVQTFTFNFGMVADASDDNARIKFGLGDSDASFYLEYIKVEQLPEEEDEGDGTNVHSNQDVSTTVYPNPASSVLYINNLDDFESFEVLNIAGKVVKHASISNAINEISLDELQAGMYFVALSSNESRYVVKVIKK